MNAYFALKSSINPVELNSKVIKCLFHLKKSLQNLLSAATAILATMIIGFPCILLLIFLPLHLNFAMRAAAIKIH